MISSSPGFTQIMKGTITDIATKNIKIHKIKYSKSFCKRGMGRETFFKKLSPRLMS